MGRGAKSTLMVIFLSAAACGGRGTGTGTEGVTETSSSTTSDTSTTTGTPTSSATDTTTGGQIAPPDCVGSADIYVCPARLSIFHEVGVTSCPQLGGSLTLNNKTDQAITVECQAGAQLACKSASNQVEANGTMLYEVEFGCGTQSPFTEPIEFVSDAILEEFGVPVTVVIDESPCGDGVCDFNGTEPVNCPEDCCGDGFCDPGEADVCPLDCG